MGAWPVYPVTHTSIIRKKTHASIEAFSPGVEKRLCKFSELKNFGAQGLFAYKTDRSARKLALKNPFNSGAECLSGRAEPFSFSLSLPLSFYPPSAAEFPATTLRGEP